MRGRHFLGFVFSGILIWGGPVLAITGTEGYPNLAESLPAGSLSWTRVWRHYQDFSELNTQESIHAKATQLSHVEEKLALLLYSLRHSRRAENRDIENLNQWGVRSYRLDDDFYPTFFQILKLWEDDISKLEKQNLYTSNLSEAQKTELSAILQLAFTIIAVKDRPLIRNREPLSYIKVLATLGPFIRFAILNDARFKQALEIYIESYVVEMINALSGSWIVNRVYPSLVAQLTIGRIERLLQIPTRLGGLNTIDLIQTDTLVTGIAVGIDSLGLDSQQHPLGFFYKIFEGISLTKEIQKKTYQWSHQGSSFTAQLSAQLHSAEGLELHWEDSLNEIRRDHHLVGAVVISPNMGDDVAVLLKRYLKYLDEEGFTVSETSQNDFSMAQVEDLFVHKGLDYLLKEAHSDGDTVNLLQMASLSRLIKAEKKDGDLRETFYVLYPKPNSNMAVGRVKPGIALRQFGEWMNRRSRITTSPLVYFNSSCWSIKRVSDEVSQIHSPYFINIPSLDSVGIFHYKGFNHMRAFINGIRAGLDFPQIKKELSNQDFRPETWRRASRFVFPHESDYRDLVSKYLNTFVDYSLVVTDESGHIVLKK